MAPKGKKGPKTSAVSPKPTVKRKTKVTPVLCPSPLVSLVSSSHCQRRRRRHRICRRCARRGRRGNSSSDVSTQ